MTSEQTTTDEAVRLPLRIVVLSVTLVWVTYFALTTLRGAFVGLDFQPELLWRRGAVTLAGIGITLVMWLILRTVENRALGVRITAALLLALPAALLVAQVNQMMFASVQEAVYRDLGEKQGVVIRRDETGNLLLEVPPLPSGQAEPDAEEGGRTIVLAPAPTGVDRLRQLTDIALGRYFLLLAWAALYLALLAAAKARMAERRESEFREAAKAAELRSLRYQVNPHFLFNTLNSLSSLIMTGKSDRAEQMLQAMANFYRHSLAEDPTSDVALEDEFALQRHYLEIEAARFPNRVHARYELPAELQGVRVPGMILQPLVENSVKYAVAPNNRPITITLAAEADGEGRVKVVVADDGPGEKQASPKHGFGIGLENVRQRLSARFGDRAHVTHGATPTGYRTELHVPGRTDDRTDG
ncbi:histidine kinase [Qipengyuania sp. JC766]|uniref:sensor histidine kinase n=1 Tax=Qipengyuania sp. JC766 TaxID=3232139 RepID=UPI0034577D94